MGKEKKERERERDRTRQSCVYMEIKRENSADTPEPASTEERTKSAPLAALGADFSH
jgi:hypothetical protein